MSDTAAELHGRLRAECAQLLGVDLQRMSPAQTVRLDRATALRLEIDTLQSKQLAGSPIDVGKLMQASEALERLLPAEAIDAPDYRRLSDEELSELERLLRKAGAKEEGPAVEDAPAVVIPDNGRDGADGPIADADQAEIARLNALVAEQRRALAVQTEQIDRLMRLAELPAPTSIAAPTPAEPASAPGPAADESVRAQVERSPREPARPPAHYLRPAEAEPWRAHVGVDGVIQGPWGPI